MAAPFRAPHLLAHFLELRVVLSPLHPSVLTTQLDVDLGEGRKSISCLRRRWWWRHIQSRVLSHHTLETNSDTFNNGKQAGTADSGVSRSLEAAADGEGAAGEETCDDCGTVLVDDSQYSSV